MVRKSRMSRGDRILLNTIMVILAITAFLFLYPLWTTVVQSFSSSRTSGSLGFQFWPKEWSLGSYHQVFYNRPQIWTGYLNTIIRTVATTVLHLIVVYFAAYSLSRKNLPFKTLFTFLIIVPMFFDGGMIPHYLNIQDLGIFNTHWALILPGVFSSWNLIIARNFVQSLPYELEESASIDGAHPLRIIFQILLPLSKPILAVLGLWVAVGQWNAYFDALLYTPDPTLKPLALVVYELSGWLNKGREQMQMGMGADFTEASVKAATIVVSLVPILCVYPFIQKYFVKGVMVGALKG